MCNCRQISREGYYPAYWYSFKCTDNNGNKKFYAFSMANDNEAKLYAEMLCSNSTLKDDGIIETNILEFDNSVFKDIKFVRLQTKLDFF